MIALVRHSLILLIVVAFSACSSLESPGLGRDYFKKVGLTGLYEPSTNSIELEEELRFVLATTTLDTFRRQLPGTLGSYQTDLEVLSVSYALEGEEQDSQQLPVQQYDLTDTKFTELRILKIDTGKPLQIGTHVFRIKYRLKNAFQSDTRMGRQFTWLLNDPVHFTGLGVDELSIQIMREETQSPDRMELQFAGVVRGFWPAGKNFFTKTRPGFQNRGFSTASGSVPVLKISQPGNALARNESLRIFLREVA